MRAAPPTPTGAAAGRRSKEPARPVGRSPEDGESAGTGRRGGPAGPRSSFEPPVRQDGCLERVEQGPALREFEDASFSRAPSEKRVVRQVSWLPDPPPSGSFPNAQPVFPISRVQWIAARGVPGDSGGGRAGTSTRSPWPHDAK